MTLSALDEHDPRLLQACAPLSKADLRLKAQQDEISDLLGFVFGNTNRKAIPGLTHDATRPNTVGLSANQVGIMKQISIVDLAIGRRGYFDLHVLINPEIVWRSKSIIEHHEGCVNLPTLWGKTRRSKRVKVRTWDRSGNELLLDVSGWAAILLQHEIDHLQGRLFLSHLARRGQADLVQAGEFAAYRKTHKIWPHQVDISDRLSIV